VLEVGASTIPFREPLTTEILTIFKDAGIKTLELCDYHPNFLYEDMSFCSFVKQAMRDMELELNSIHIHLKHRDERCDLASLDPSEREKALTGHRQSVDFAAELGGCILVTHDIAIQLDEQDGRDRLTSFVDNMRVVAEYAAPKGVRLALENTGRGGYTSEPERLVSLIQTIDSPNVGAVIDTGHRNLVGDPAEALRTVGGHLFTLHLHDNHGEEDEHLLPGRGKIEWDEVMKALREIGYDGALMYELSRPDDVQELADNGRWIQGAR
jgi:sugar phosphate isomerase/epimerase